MTAAGSGVQDKDGQATPFTDRLAGTGVVGQQVGEAVLRKHPLVDGDPLMRQGINLADLGREGRIEQVSIGQPLALDQHTKGIRVTQEVQARNLRLATPGSGSTIHRRGRL